MNWNGKKTLITLGAASMLALAVAGGAVAAGEKGGFGMPGGFAGRGGPGAQLDFATLDADGNGMLNEDDLAAAAAKRFTEADTNGDGLLDKDEIVAQITARIEARGLEAETKGGVRWTPSIDPDRIAWMADGMILRQDADKSGTLSPDELTPKGDRVARLIERFDTDGDGALSEAEFDAAKTKMAERGAHRDGPRGGDRHGGDRHGGGQHGGGQHRGGQHGGGN